jgi:hypothetical protein
MNSIYPLIFLLIVIILILTDVFEDSPPPVVNQDTECKDEDQEGKL